MIKSAIIDVFTGRAARVSRYGEVVTGRYDYSDPQFQSMSSTGTAYNFFAPISNKRLVITDILVDADRNVSAATPATIDVYESSGSTDTTIDKQILKLELLKNSFRDFTALNLIVSTGKWVNAKTDDATVNITIAGYYVEEV
jgi:hypothetical protein